MKMLFTTAYHPQSNGLVERYYRRLKEALRARLAGAAWPQHLPWVLLGLRAAPREDSGILAAELVYGCPLSLPGQFLSATEPPPASFISQLRSSLPCVSDRTGCSPPTAPPPLALRTASFVYIWSPPLLLGLAPAYRGPYRVRVTGNKYFVVDIGGFPTAVTVDRLKPHLGKAPFRQLRPLIEAGLLCRAAANPSSPLPCTRLGGGGNVEAANAAPSTAEIRECIVVNL
jgi:hypothetical protein